MIGTKTFSLQRNGSDTYDGEYEMWTGEGNLQNVRVHLIFIYLKLIPKVQYFCTHSPTL